MQAGHDLQFIDPKTVSRCLMVKPVMLKQIGMVIVTHGATRELPHAFGGARPGVCPQKADTQVRPFQKLRFDGALVLLTLFMVIFSSLNCGAAASPPQVTIVFRYDDYSSRSATDLEEQIIEAFKQCQACCTFSIIPFVKAVNYLDINPQAVLPLTTTKAEMARKAMAAGAVDAAQHGYSHQRQGYTRGWYTGYEGLDYDSQMNKIKNGKVFLEKILDTKITTFVPPYNSYDANTLKVLEQLNFQCLSASLRGQTVPSSSLKILPETCTLAQLRDVIHYARKNADYHPIICVMIHQYDFVGIDDTMEAEKISRKTTLDEFSELLSWIASQNDLRIRSISQLLQENIDLSMDRFVNNKYYLELVHLKPAWWPPHYGIYLPADTAFNIRFRNLFFNLTITRIKNILYISIFYLIILIIGFIATYLLSLIFFSLLGIIDIICKYLGLIILCSLFFYMIFTAKIEYKKLAIIVGALGVSLGIWLSWLRWKKSGPGKAGG
jgi:peptidoglycan/xylan/chitin deacetylase (PgdA/CDA1 family)